MLPTWLLRLRTFVIAMLGVGGFHLLGLPLPFLFGPMVALLLAGLLGVELRSITPVSNAARSILGVAVGASITPALVHQLPSMAVTISLVPVFIILSGLVGVPYFRRFCGFDATTAYYSAMPGGLQDMVLFGHEAGGRTRTISLVQATRLLAFVTVAPFILHHYYGLNLHRPVGDSAASLANGQMLLMLGLAITGWWAGVRVKLFGAAMLGPMVLAGIAAMTGYLSDRPPREAILFAQVFVGLSIGAHYSGLTFKELKRDVFSGLGFVVLLGALSAVFITSLSYWKLGDPVAIFLAYAPAGQAEMAVFAIVVGADLGYVVTHHLVRLVLVIIGAPVAAAWLRRQRKEVSSS
jgi:membrane AbrB-like protein